MAASAEKGAGVRRVTLVALSVGLVLLATLATTGCLRASEGNDRSSATAAIEHDEAVLKGAATSIEADVRMRAGTLSLAADEGDAKTAFEGSFVYPTADWKPAVTYDVKASRGELVVSQPAIEVSPKSPLDGSGNEWHLKLAARLPTRLSLVTGVGESDVDLRGVEVTWLAVKLGGGTTRIDLSGRRTRSIISRIEPGTGGLKIVLPRDVGVRVVGEAAAANEVEAADLTNTGDAYMNAAWGKPGPKIELHLLRGGGPIRLTLAEP